ncbi:MAG: hypothetical protein JXR37_08960 [Kiritimatiellae bacterium]|nr:hypothetical protein [Kiritimatiellia bacterium]
MLADAEREGLPLAPLMNKTREGLLKKQPLSGIEQAVDQRLGRLRTARDLVAGAKARGAVFADEPATLAVLVEALERRVAEPALREMIGGLLCTGQPGVLDLARIENAVEQCVPPVQSEEAAPAETPHTAAEQAADEGAADAESTATRAAEQRAQETADEAAEQAEQKADRLQERTERKLEQLEKKAEKKSEIETKRLEKKHERLERKTPGRSER